LDKDLAARFSRPVRLINDANCFALSESNGGAGAGFCIVFGAILGTGYGSGITVNEELLMGANNISGEWAHNPLPWPTTDELPGLKCKCAKRGCIETFLSGTGLERQHAAFTTNQITAKDIVAQAELGDAQAEHNLDFYEDQLARARASIINVIDPNVIVLGGGLSNVARLYGNVPKLWSQWVFSDQVDTLLLPPKFGDSSGVRGAAWLWAEGE
jgi:predicted NBD/HSP70 family sugar kinase